MPTNSNGQLFSFPTTRRNSHPCSVALHACPLPIFRRRRLAPHQFIQPPLGLCYRNQHFFRPGPKIWSRFLVYKNGPWQSDASKSKARPFGPGFLIPHKAESVAGNARFQKVSTVWRQPALLPDRLWACLAQSPDNMPGGVSSMRKPPCRPSRLAKPDSGARVSSLFGRRLSRFATFKVSSHKLHLSTMKVRLRPGTHRSSGCLAITHAGMASQLLTSNPPTELVLHQCCAQAQPVMRRP